MDCNGQRPLFTTRGNAYSRETQKRDLRVDVIQTLGDVFGESVIEDEQCPECSGSVHAVAGASVAFVYCRCGWSVEFAAKELLEDDEL